MSKDEKNNTMMKVGAAAAAAVVGGALAGPAGALLAVSAVGASIASGNAKNSEQRKNAQQCTQYSINKIREIHNNRND